MASEQPIERKEQFRQSEERFKLLVESVRDYAIFMLDPSGKTVLEDQGAQVRSFASAQDALTALQSSKPTMLICDIGMPKMDGY